MCCVCVLSHSVRSDSCNPMDCSQTGSSVMGFSRQEFWSGCYFVLQEIFPTQGSHLYLLCLLHWRISGGFFTTVLPGKPKYALGLPISNTKGRKYLLVLGVLKMVRLLTYGKSHYHIVKKLSSN